MNNFIFYSPTEFVFGRDTEAQTGVLVQKYGARKIMIVYGGGSVIRSGLLARVEKSLQEVRSDDPASPCTDRFPPSEYKTDCYSVTYADIVSPFPGSPDFHSCGEALSG